MNGKIRVSAVGYLNSKPLIYGLENTGIAEDIELSLDIPSLCAEKLLTGQVDIGLVPVAIIPSLKESFILSEYCIGAVGPVKSVVLYSNVPLDQIERVYLDYHSRTSVNLVKVLASNYWNINPEWLTASEGFETLVNGHTAAVIIGDRTFDLEGKYNYAYDLAGEWEAYTGLPFVFACWVANKKLPSDFVTAFEQAIAFGIENKEVAIQEWSVKMNKNIDVREYLEKYISFPLDDKKKEGMRLFLSLLEVKKPIAVG